MDGEIPQDKQEVETGMPLGLEDEREHEESGELPVTEIHHPLELDENPEVAPRKGAREDAFISMISLFSPLPKEDAQRLIGDIVSQFCPAGQTIIEEGDAGDSIYLIKAGHAKVVSHILGREIELAILSPGRCIRRSGISHGETPDSICYCPGQPRGDRNR